MSKGARQERDVAGSSLRLSRRQALWSLAVGAVGIAGGGLAWRRAGRVARTTEVAGEATPLVPRSERRPTLAPAAFTGKTRRAYEVAGEIPGVLDRLKCYCHCEGVGHVTLLSCYTDLHAST